jgi:hypothetical protein
MPNQRRIRQSRRRNGHSSDSILTVLYRLVQAMMTAAIATLVSELVKQLFALHVL